MIAMKWGRRAVLVVAISGIVICIVLLLNFTASNPTHRRYSSKEVLITGPNQSIGASGETILAKDLGLAINDDEAGQQQCLCGLAGLTDQQRCKSCIVSLASITTYRIPDFVSSKLIADSKNKKSLLITDRDYEQLSDYAEAAQALDIPLWIFVRVDTHVDPKYYELTRSTGGDVVKYFAVSGYEDSTDEAAEMGLIICSLVGIGMVGLEVFSARSRTSRSRTPRERSPRARPPQPTPTVRISSAIDEAEKLLNKAKDKAKDV